MDFSEAYRKVVNSGIFVVRNGAPVGVYDIHDLPERKFRRSDKQKQLMVVFDVKNPQLVEDWNTKSYREKLIEIHCNNTQNPNLLALDLARVLVLGFRFRRQNSPAIFDPTQ